VTVFTYAPVWAPALSGAFARIAPWCGLAADRLLTLALFLIGAGLSRQALRRTGVRPLQHAFVLWAFVTVATAAALWLGWIVAPKV
jgi:predicted Na+-dependent transporter